MKFSAVHQLVAGFSLGDAISREAMILQKLLQAMGYVSEIYAELPQRQPDGTMPCKTLDELPDAESDLLIYHYAGKSESTERYVTAQAKKVMLYHNITPGHYFYAFDSELGKQLDSAREDLVRVAKASDALWAVSDFNAQEVRDLGFSRVSVFPLLFDPEFFDRPSNPANMKALDVGLTQILFVGRLVPNKNVEELMLAFSQYHLRINPKSCLRIVGSEWSCPRYFAMLRMLCDELGNDKILFQRYVPDAHLPSLYASADLFVSPSNHEGFCLPLVEAMYKQVPVIAKNRGGMPEAMGGAGCLYDDMNPRELAELMHLVMSDSTVHDKVLSSQHLRLKALAERKPGEELTRLLDTF